MYIFQDLLAGGTESSAVTVEWAISELLKKPEIFSKATKELDGVVGRNNWVKEKDIPNLPYIEAIVKETMRLHPVAPMLVPRLSREDCKVHISLSITISKIIIFIIIKLHINYNVMYAILFYRLMDMTFQRGLKCWSMCGRLGGTHHYGKIPMNFARRGLLEELLT